MREELFDITGMTCSACSARVQKAVAGLAGVREAGVNLLKNTMQVSFDEKMVNAASIAAAVERAGYGASVHGAGEKAAGGPDPAALELREMKRRLAVSFVFTVPLFYLAMGHMLNWPLPDFFLGDAHALNYAFTQFLLLVPVIFVNFKYFRMGFKTLFSGAPNMDSLIAIGSGAAAVSGVYAIYAMGDALGRGDWAAVHHLAMNLYFESAAMILTLITLGKYFEARAKGRTSEAISKLISLAPKTATVLRNGLEERIPRDEVRLGDTVIVKAGESAPVDGTVMDGEAFVDESALTGESVPARKRPGDRIMSASINKSGYFTMRATRVGDQTTLAQIIKLVDAATSSKAPIARLADKISGIFVPVVIVVAVCATVVWLALGQEMQFAVSIGISVLVISCPCALGLATPTAIMVGAGRGAAAGILIKSAQAIETAHNIDTVVLDKTGTITEGRPALTDLISAAQADDHELLLTAASLEKLSEHPLGKAVVSAAETAHLTLKPVADFRQMEGQGVCGRIEGRLCCAGNARLLAGLGIQDGVITAKGESLAALGKTVLYITRDKEILGLVAVADVIKKSSPQAVAEFGAMGIEVIMLTGDNAGTAAAIQKQAGIGRVLAEVLPQDKEREIRQLQEKGRKVAMIGDGVNDAPALARADVGIAIGAGTDIAIESADIVLMKSDLLDAVGAIQLSRAVMRNIRQNLFWAFIYNIVGIPVAAGVFYGLWGLTLNPMIAAAAMSLSSVSVVSNALRLRFFKPRLVMASASAALRPVTEDNHVKRSMAMKKIMQIEGMSCGHCSASVEKALRAVPGVAEVTVDLAGKMASIAANEEVGDAALKDAVTAAGYEVTGIKPA